MHISYQKTADIRFECDVCVVGGGRAGIAAAIANKTETTVRGIDISSIQKELKAQGAYLPNFVER